MSRWWRLLPLLTAGFLGCQEQPATPPAAPAPEAVSPAPPPTPARPAFDKTKGYLHEPSGVGALYPRGWDNLGVTDKGDYTMLVLRRREPPVEATLYWSKLDPPARDKTVGDLEYESLKSQFGEKAGKPEPVQKNDQSGYRLTFAGGPKGATGAELKGVILVFAKRQGEQWWKIKLRVTSREDIHEKAAEAILRQYRF